MLSDFNKAQEVLKDKISALQILYVRTAPAVSVALVRMCRQPVSLGAGSFTDRPLFINSAHELDGKQTQLPVDSHAHL